MSHGLDAELGGGELLRIIRIVTIIAIVIAITILMLIRIRILILILTVIGIHQRRVQSEGGAVDGGGIL